MPIVDLTKHASGILLKYGQLKIGLDVGISDGLTLLSHSHTDHVADLPRARHVVATRATLETYQIRGGEQRWKTTELEYNETIVHDGIRITSLNAGHVLGSSMFLIGTDDGPSVLYTGDFNVVDSVVHRAASAVEADVLVMETTYGRPEWVFPERSLVHREIVASARELIDRGRIPCFKVYSLGKAQETVAVLQQAGIEVVSGNRVIDDITAVYNQHGASLRLTPLSAIDSVNMLAEGCAIVMSSRGAMYEQLRRQFGDTCAADVENRSTEISLTGWALHGLWGRGQKGIPLSAHSDFPGLVSFVTSVRPRIVYTFTDNGQCFAAYMAERGINTVPIGDTG